MPSLRETFCARRCALVLHPISNIKSLGSGIPLLRSIVFKPGANDWGHFMNESYRAGLRRARPELDVDAMEALNSAINRDPPTAPTLYRRPRRTPAWRKSPPH